MRSTEPINQPAGMTAPASELSVAEIWQAYAVSRDESLRNRLLVQYLPLTRAIARQIHTRMPSSIEYDDLAQAAALGLRSAIGSYNPERGIPFEHYCGPRVRGAVLDYLRSLDWAPRMLRSRVQRLQEMARQMEMETGTAPTDEEVSAALHLPVAEVETLRREMAAPTRVRIASGEEKGSGEDSADLDLLPDRGIEDPEREAQRADLREFLTRGLSQVERRVTMMYYYDDMSLREISHVMGLCESRVSQIHQGVIARLRERMHRIGGASVDD